MISDQAPSSHPRAVGALARLAATGRRAVLPTLVCLCGWFALGAAAAQARPFIDGFQPSTLATTVPTNGDLNPYGIVTVPRSVGALERGDVLVSNFNNSANQQGTGTTIVQIPPGDTDTNAGDAPVFAQINAKALPGPCPGGIGLTTALAVTRSGFVIVGSLPTSNGMSNTAMAGCLLVLNSHGKVIETIAGGPINGPWDMTAVDHGFFTTLYVTNVLNGTVAAGTQANGNGNVVDRGTVVRIQLLTIPGIRPVVFDEDVIATGFAERTDPVALVLGPTGVALGRDGTLYVADTVNSRIAVIPDAPFRFFPATGGGRTVFEGMPLNAPLGMTLAPNGDILTANGNDGNIVETTPRGTSAATVAADPSAGDLFGLTLTPDQSGVYFVDDGTNTLNLLGP
jgi:NHL repeat-containing protein